MKALITVTYSAILEPEDVRYLPEDYTKEDFERIVTKLAKGNRIICSPDDVNVEVEIVE